MMLRDKRLWPCTPTDNGVLPSGVRVWAARLDSWGEEMTRFRAGLSNDERERASRFALDRDRVRFVAGRGLLRVVLGSCLGAKPESLEFRYGAKGKPALGGAFAGSGLEFNLAHSGGLAVFAVARRGVIGVDVEQIRPVPELAELIKRFFSTGECAELEKLSGEEKARGFFRIWTRKEAWLKAVGEGITGPLQSIDVSGPLGQEKLCSGPPEDSPAVRLRLHDLAPAPGFLGALALTSPPSFAD